MKKNRRWAGVLGLCCACLFAGLAPARAADLQGDEVPADRHSFVVELKANFRSSDLNRFPVPFPFPPEQIPRGQERVYLETVDPGDRFELSAVTLAWGFRTGESFEAFLKVDGVDRHDRNPTSSGAEIDVDEAWIRFGREMEPAIASPGWGAYWKLGKIGAFERQDDRHLESYGLVSTAFNRFEDVGVEIGIDLGRWLYLKTSYTAGNPLFLRDPNALAGDFGTPEFLQTPPAPKLNSGIVIPYDTDVDDIDFDHAETGIGLGLRHSSPGERFGTELLIWARGRDLAESAPLDDTFYGGDLDLLRGPTPMEAPFPISGDRKEEVGANFWLYADAFSLFAQVVDQEVAGLERTGFEIELAYFFDLPVGPAVGGHQLFPYFQPSIRFSRLDPEFGVQPRTVAPSFTWDWEKLDAGVRVGIHENSDLTVEVSRNRFILASGREAENDEVLATLVLRWGR